MKDLQNIDWSQYVNNENNEEWEGENELEALEKEIKQQEQEIE